MESAVLELPGGRRPLNPDVVREAAPRCVAVACVLAVAAATSERADWQPVSLVVALGAAMVIADVMSIRARHVRMSAGLMVQVVAMALLGPVPAAVIGIVATVVDARSTACRLAASARQHGRVRVPRPRRADSLFDLLGASFGLDPQDTAYALLVVPVNFVVASFNLGLVAATTPGLTPARSPLRRSATAGCRRYPSSCSTP